jgi:hypothetical protein
MMNFNDYSRSGSDRGADADLPPSEVWFRVNFRDLAPPVQRVVMRHFPPCVAFDTCPDKIIDQIIVLSMIPCLPNTVPMFIKHMRVTVPDLYMEPCCRVPYDSSIIYQLPQQPVHPHNSNGGSNIDPVCMCKMCKRMPGFPTEGDAWLAISGEMGSYSGRQVIEFPMTKYSRFILPFTHGAKSEPTVAIELPPNMLNASDGLNTPIVQRTSFHKFLEFIRKRLNLDGKKVRSLRKVVARATTAGPYSSEFEIRFKRDSAGNLFLLFSNPLGDAKKMPASAVISYHDLRMVCSAWNSAMVRPNCDYVQRLQIIAGVYPKNRKKPSPRQIPQTMPPIFRSLDQIARSTSFITATDESKSPLHQMLPGIPATVIDIIGQYCCIANTGTPKYLVDVDGTSHANPTYDPSSDTTTTVPVAGHGLGSFSTLFLDKLYDPSILNEIASLLFCPYTDPVPLP